MTDHLPDCDDYAFSGAGFHPKCERICICRQVRRIEHRVFQEQIEGRQSGSRAEHLPECPLLEPCSADIPQHGFCSRQNTICIHCDQNTICIHCERECICARLRACEERVLREAQLRVAALRDPWPTSAPGTIKRSDALAAIDALKEGS